MKIILAGGGTMGSASPLIAIFQEIKKQQPNAEFLWLATKNGPEDKLVSTYGISLKKINSGKLRRYFSLKNLADPFLVFFGFYQSLTLILKFKPNLIVAAGGFIAVPVVWSGWLLKIPCIIHQQDIVPGLANKLMAPFATIITVTFEKSLNDFPLKKTFLVGNPVRADVLAGSKQSGFSDFNLEPGLPTILFIGGGTGAESLNNLVLNCLGQLTEFCQIIHLTGGKPVDEKNQSRYHCFDFLTDQLKNAYAVSDLVVSRSGMSVLTELAVLGKPMILIPLPNSHQEKNAEEFFRHNAAVLIPEKNILSVKDFVTAVKSVLMDKSLLENLGRNASKMMPSTAAERIASLILEKFQKT